MVDETAVTDGRVERGSRNRRAVVDALIALTDEGVLQPSVAQVADRAGVSERSVFRHFEDMASLHEVAAQIQMERIAPLFRSVGPDGTLADRVAALVAGRCELLEANAPVRRAARLREPFYPEVRRILDRGRRALRHQLEETFAPELDRLSDPVRVEVLAALDVATSWDTWEVLRHVQRLAEDEATAVVRRTVSCLLA